MKKIVSIAMWAVLTFTLFSVNESSADDGGEVTQICLENFCWICDDNGCIQVAYVDPE